MTLPLPLPLASLVVKDGVAIGLLGQRDRDLVLALAARALEPGQAYSESRVNDQLSAWLEGTGAMLRTDHVELRRWLVDAGYVARDGFGRAYWRGEAEASRSLGVLGDAPAGSLEASIDALRIARSAERAARRRAFDAGHARREAPQT